MTGTAHDEAVRRAIDLAPDAPTAERIVDITTTGRRTGLPRRIEIFLYRVTGRTYLCSGTVPSPSWYANLASDPRMTLHLKHRARADVPATAHPVTDPAERRRVLGAIVDDLNQPSNPGHLPQPVLLEDWLGCRLVELTFTERAPGPAVSPRGAG